MADKLILVSLHFFMQVIFMYDYLIVGSGLFGSVIANLANKAGKKVLVIEKRNHIGGNVYTENIDGINVHKYGSHIFHTSNKKVWDYINGFAEFNRFTNSPIARYKDEVYNLPFNLNTFSRMFNLFTPDEIYKRLEEERLEAKKNLNGKEPQNLEEQARLLIGETAYLRLVKGYTEKQWGRSCKDLPPFIIKRLPVRMTYDNNYFNDVYQGIPKGGYTALIEKMLRGVEVRLSCDYFDNREEFSKIAKKTVFTGPVDRYYDYCFGHLGYRSVKFSQEKLDIKNYQGNAVVNYTEKEIPYTRIIEHKHFEYGETLGKPDNLDFTVISREYSEEWTPEKEPYYPVNDQENQALYGKYKELSKNDKNVIFGGRLGLYKYLDMDKVIEQAFEQFEALEAQ